MSVAVQDSKPRANPLSPRPLRAADFCRMSQQQLDAAEHKIIMAMNTEPFRAAVKKFTSKGK